MRAGVKKCGTVRETVSCILVVPRSSTRMICSVGKCEYVWGVWETVSWVHIVPRSRTRMISDVDRCGQVCNGVDSC